MASESPFTCGIIAIEGCIGSGKTSIAQGLATLRASRLLLEDFSAVPFLKKFYADPKRFALETEFAFLLHHYHQLHEAAREGGEIIADFTIGKDMLFAELNMPGKDERKAFADLYSIFVARLPKVALTVFVAASDGLIMERIERRGRAFELEAGADYYRRLNAMYEGFFATHDGPSLRVTADELDFLQNPDLFRWLSDEIDKKLAVKFPQC